MCPVDRLVLNRGVPPAVEQEDIVRELQIQPDAAGAVTHQEDVLGRVALEAIQDRAAVLEAPCRERAGAERTQVLGQYFQRLDLLREDDGLAIALGHFGQVGLELLHLDAFAGRRVEVANLLEPHHQLEHMTDGNGFAQGIELDDAFILGPVVAEPFAGDSST